MSSKPYLFTSHFPGYEVIIASFYILLSFGGLLISSESNYIFQRVYRFFLKAQILFSCVICPHFYLFLDDFLTNVNISTLKRMNEISSPSYLFSCCLSCLSRPQHHVKRTEFLYCSQVLSVVSVLSALLIPSPVVCLG